ncbi:MAG: class I SAM-dependent methyltransferase [Solirubrobacterales bacterium]
MSAPFHWDPDTYLETIRDQVPGFDALQEAAVAAVPFPPATALDLGIGTGETSRRLLEAYPQARITGLDASPEMVFRARRLGIEVRLARMEDPLPDGPWDLVVAVLSVHHLDAAQKRNLFRRVREQARALVLAEVVAVDPPRERKAPIDAAHEFAEKAADLAAWSGGEIVWSEGDLAVIRAIYE